MQQSLSEKSVFNEDIKREYAGVVSSYRGNKGSSGSDRWTAILKHDPMPHLLSSSNTAITFFASRDLLRQDMGGTKILWELPIPSAIVRKQQEDGSWKYPGGNKSLRSAENYSQLETYRNLGFLVEMYGFTKSSPVITRAADYLFGFQTNKGDIRGILGNQYSPYYSAAIVELLIKAGYSKDARIESVFEWLGRMRQNDGGWALPLRTRGKNLEAITSATKPLEPDRTTPFSHLVTGMVLRAYAADRTHRKSPEAKIAGKLLLSRFFQRDSYADRRSADYWLRFSYPFWFTDLISAMDTLSTMGVTAKNPQMAEGVQWFVDNQQKDGGWKLKVLKNEKKFETSLWLDLSICRVLRRMYS